MTHLPHVMLLVATLVTRRHVVVQLGHLLLKRGIDAALRHDARRTGRCYGVYPSQMIRLCGAETDNTVEFQDAELFRIHCTTCMTLVAH